MSQAKRSTPSSVNDLSSVSIVRWESDRSTILRGERLDFRVEVKNTTSSDQSFLGWLELYLSDGHIASGDPFSRPISIHLISRPISIHLTPYQVLKKQAEISIPNGLCPGKYLLRFLIGAALGEMWDKKDIDVTIEPPMELKQNICNLCGDKVDSNNIIWREDELLLVRCPSCSLVFDLEVQQEARQNNENAWLFDISGPNVGVYHGTEFYLSRKNELVCEAELNRIRKKSTLPCQKLLDFGCGVGVLLMQARRKGFEVYGVEANSDAVDYAQRKHLFSVFSTTDQLREHTGNNFFDVVILRHVLEHLPDPMGVLKELYELLRPGGLIVVIVPYFSILTRKLLPNRMPGFTWQLINKGHQFYFTRKTLRQYLVEAGFDKVKYRPSFFGGFAMRLLGDRIPVEIKRIAIRMLNIIAILVHMMGLHPILTAYSAKPEEQP